MPLTLPTLGLGNLPVSSTAPQSREPLTLNTHPQQADTVSIRFGQAPSPVSQAEVDREFQAAGQKFAIKLQEQLAARTAKESTVFSPASVWNLMVLLLNGSEAETRDELLDAMGLKALTDRGATIEQLTAANQATQQTLAALEDVTLESGYGVWAREGKAFQPAFADRVRAMSGEVSTFTPGNADPINQWADKKTHGMIKKVLEDGDLPQDSAAVLANAIYLKANWSKPFDKEKTATEAFHGLQGETRVPMMRLDATDKIKNEYGKEPLKLQYSETTDAQIVSLPYGPNIDPYGRNSASNQLSMFVILPKTSLKDLTGKLFQTTGKETYLETLLTQTAHSEKRNVNLLKLPSFKTESEVKNLVSILHTLGVSKAFTHSANFKAMMADPIFVDQIKQKAVIDVNEEGTEAAAVTVAVMRTTSIMMPPPPINMTVDKPFLYVIRDAKTKQNLFVGSVTDLPNK